MPHGKGGRKEAVTDSELQTLKKRSSAQSIQVALTIHTSFSLSDLRQIGFFYLVQTREKVHPVQIRLRLSDTDCYLIVI
ncbi:MAG: hypothetical protein ACREBS_02790 [Nitrososphaerales archaeon]